MTIFRLSREPVFPDPALAQPNGLLAVGGDLKPRRLLAAYASGIFPWYDESQPLLWWSPPERAIWLPGDFRPSHSLRKTLRRKLFEPRIDTCFTEVIRRCGETYRPGQHGTWITDAMQAAYTELHRRGFAHSFETFQDGRLVGGLYGVSLGAAFFGESMFSLETDASKVAFAHLAETCFAWNFHFIDGQMHTPHLESLGVRMVERTEYLERLARALTVPTRLGHWTRPDPGPAPTPG